MKIEEIPIHFIHCRPRSGSTLLTQMLNEKDDVISTFEEPFVLIFYPKYKLKTKWTKQDIETFIEEYWHLSIKDPSLFFISKQELRKKLLATADNLSFDKLIRIIYTSYIPILKKKNIKTIVDKQFWFSFHWKRLIKLFPDSKHVILIRDFHDHLGSMKKRNMGKFNSVEGQAYAWRIGYAQLLKLYKKNPAITYLLKYEKLVKNPELELKNLCAFLNITYTEKMLEFHFTHNQHDKNIRSNSKNFNQIMEKISELKKPINSSRIGIGKSILTHTEYSNAEKICNSIAEGFDYKTSELNNAFIKPRLLLKVIFEQKIKARLYYHFPHWLKLKLKKINYKEDLSNT